MPAEPSLVRFIFDHAFNQGNLAIVDDLLSVNSVAHMPGWSMSANRLGLKQMIATLRSAFPDLHCTVQDEIEQAGKLAALWTMRGTHTGSFFGNLPTGRLVEVQGFIFAHTKNERIVEGWLMIDQIGVLQQIGVVPPPRGKP
jgi:predicted ester cyclase